MVKGGRKSGYITRQKPWALGQIILPTFFLLDKLRWGEEKKEQILKIFLQLLGSIFRRNKSDIWPGSQEHSLSNGTHICTDMHIHAHRFQSFGDTSWLCFFLPPSCPSSLQSHGLQRIMESSKVQFPVCPGAASGYRLHRKM